MPKQTDIRRLAMQALYQIDVRGCDDRTAVLEGMQEDFKVAGFADEAFTIAEAAWQVHGEIGLLSTHLAPEWPTYRQPPLDRAILRLAYYEVTSGKTPDKVAINEAVELSKNFCAEQSPAFVNGVLDKVAKLIREGDIQSLLTELQTAHQLEQEQLDKAKAEVAAAAETERIAQAEQVRQESEARKAAGVRKEDRPMPEPPKGHFKRKEVEPLVGIVKPDANANSAEKDESQHADAWLADAIEADASDDGSGQSPSDS